MVVVGGGGEKRKVGGGGEGRGENWRVNVLAVHYKIAFGLRSEK